MIFLLSANTKNIHTNSITHVIIKNIEKLYLFEECDIKLFNFYTIRFLFSYK